MFGEHLQLVLIVAVSYECFTVFPYSSEAAAAANVCISSDLRFWFGEL